VRHHRVLTAALLLLAATPASAGGDCGDPFTPIARIQGEGERSPLVGQPVTVEGVMTLDARGDGGLQGFYLQQSEAEADDNPRTSEALFVYTRRPGGQPGTRLRLTGEVREYRGLTELANVQTLILCGPAPLPEPLPLELSARADLEPLENMRVAVSTTATVVDSHNLARYGELELAPSDPVIPTEYRPPAPGVPDLPARNGHGLILDDARGVRDPRPIPWPSGQPGLRLGDTLSDLQGVLDYRFNRWRLQPTRPPRHIPANPRPPAPPRPDTATLRVMAFNLANLFNGDGQGGGFPTPRGATSEAQYRRQLDRVVALLTAPDPDILTLSELENDGYDEHSAAADLARALGPRWHFVATPGADGRDAIRTLIYYRRDRVRPVGPPTRFSSGPGRPPQIQAFQRSAGGPVVRVVAVHLKSKSCQGAAGEERDRGDGQGCHAGQRTRAVTALVDGLRAPLEPVAGTLIAGDFNSYSQETPLQVLAEHGYVNLLPHFHPCTPAQCRHYTYRYRGHRGALDHILASSALLPSVLAAQAWLVNTDEPRGPGLPEPDSGPWGVSDHNPVIVDLRL
jgi:hypothetical protein